MNKAVAEFEQQHGREPNLVELAEILEMKIEDVRELRKVVKTTISTDAPFGEEGGKTILDTTSVKSDMSPVKKVEKDSLDQDLSDVLSVLNPREYAILEAYFGLNDNTPLTLEEIGERFGLTRERVRQTKQKTLAKLRNVSGSSNLSVYL